MSFLRWRFDFQKDGKDAWCQHQWRIPQPLGPGELRLPASVHQAFPYLGYATDWHMRVTFLTRFRNPSRNLNFSLFQGNMKQHMLTHKIRDMPSHLFENKRSPSFGAPSSVNDDSINENTSGSSNMPEESRIQPPPSPVKLETPPPPPPPPSKRSPPEADLPVPKRQPGGFQLNSYSRRLTDDNMHEESSFGIQAIEPHFPSEAF